MIKVIGKPVIEHVVDLLKSHNIKDLNFTLHYLPELIQEYFGDGSNFDVKISYEIEESPLGTAGSVKNIEDKLDETFVVISGDLLTDMNLSQIINFHKKKGALVTIALTRVSNPLQYGITMVNDDNRVTRFLEKPSWGEVFTDTVNAGVYVVEPEVLKYIQAGKEVDFSKNVFPVLLEKNEPVYGYPTHSYWCDIGNIQQYLQANYDALTHVVKLKISVKEVEENVWIGEGSELSKAVNVKKPLFVGKNCSIKSGSNVGEFSVICDGVTIDERTTIKRSILLDKAIVGTGSELLGCVVGERCNIGAYSTIYDSAIIGDDCRLGKRCTIKSGVRMWPDKIVDVGSTVNMDLRWGIKWMKDLFSEWGITGLANIEITPEIAVKLGASLGTFFGAHSRKTKVAISRDPHKSSRMIKWALISGLMSAGVDVCNLRITPGPVVRFFTKNSEIDAGISINVPQVDPRAVNIQIFDSHGVNLDRISEKKIQEIFFKEDMRKVFYDEVGVLIYPTGFEEDYCKAVSNYIDSSIIKERKPRVIVDCSNGSGSLLIPYLLNLLGCEVISINTRIDEFIGPKSFENLSDSLSEISGLVKAWHADIGMLFDSDADRVMFVDEVGNVISGDITLAGMVKEILRERNKGTIVVSVTASRAVDVVAQKYGGTIIRSKLGAYPLVRTIQLEKAIFGGEESGAFILPEFHFGYDGIITAVKMLEIMCKRNVRISEIMSEVPVFAKAQEIIDCPFKFRGMIMRTLIEESRDHHIDTMEGIKIFHEGDWVAIIPSSDEPVMKLYAEADTYEKARMLIAEYAMRIRELLPKV
jgi:mannose-1-phosphate guanylyltransferase/phosphomannomutase